MAVDADCRPMPPSTSASREKVRRSRGSKKATTKIAPEPMDASSSVKVPAPPRCRPRATSGSRASKAVE